ncbi:MAG TPA: FGGY family carbohydrate kinase [Acidimicrobiales bacterium]|nr:FGGY family carbohydrate kinase [Acidimicrobiales bacterium]
MGYVIGLDVGSQSVKGVLVDPDGMLVGEASSPCEMTYPQSAWAEQDPMAWEEGVATVVRKLTAANGHGQVTHLGLACQVDGVAPVDRALRPLRPAIIWLDRRASLQAASLASAVGDEELFDITGLNADSSHIAPKLMWLRDEQPEVYRAARYFSPVAGYLLGWLTGAVAQDHANASSTLLYDVKRREWSEQLLDAADLELAKLAPICQSTDVVGTLTSEAADRLGLTVGCRVVTGTGDEHGACLGAGIVRKGSVADITGTAEPVAAAADVPTADPGRLVETHAHSVPGMWLVENPGFVSGGSILWLAEAVLGTDQGAIFRLAEGAPPGSDGLLFLPALSGAMSPRWNDKVRGVFAGLAMSHGKATLARAVLEGCAYAMRDIVDRLDALDLAGPEIRVIGGGARSSLWMQIKADVTGRVTRSVLQTDAAAVGAAMLAGVAAGVFTDLEDAVRRVVRLAPVHYEPDPSRTEVYTEGYARYRSLFDRVETLWS